MAEKYAHSSGYELIKYINTWTQINPSHGCVWDCGYCVQEKDRWYQGNGIVKEYSPDDTIERIVNDPLISKGIQPLTFYNNSDPFLPQNRKDLVYMLKKLDKMRFRNIVGLITKTLPDRWTLRNIRKLRRLKPVILVSYANLDKSIVKAPKKNRIKLMQLSKKYRIPTLLYLRPLVKEWTDEEKLEELAHETLDYVNGVVISGLIMTDDIKDKLEKRGIIAPKFENSAKHLNHDLFEDAKRILRSVKEDVAIFQSTSCGVSYMYKIPNYNGYYALRRRENGTGNCKHTCYEKQRDICRKGIGLSEGKLAMLLKGIGKKGVRFQIGKGFINLYDEPSTPEHYFLRHNTCYHTYGKKSMKEHGTEIKYSVMRRIIGYLLLDD